jgi:hypothetical protein
VEQIGSDVRYDQMMDDERPFIERRITI